MRIIEFGYFKLIKHLLKMRKNVGRYYTITYLRFYTYL